jgi:hypothetical protein
LDPPAKAGPNGPAPTVSDSGARFGGRRANVGVDIFNLFTSAVYQYNLTYNTAAPATWLQPSSLVVARFAKLSVQIDF